MRMMRGTLPHEKVARVDKYSCYAELKASEKEGTDFKRVVVPQMGAFVVVIAPHAGGIEPKTGAIARLIAGTEFSLYLFCGRKKNGNRNRDLHITSRNFDEPRCVKLVSKHRWVVAIHGCDEEGERVLLGGLDKTLVNDFASALKVVGILAETSGHKYTGTYASNICNRGASNAGAQFELSLPFRKGNQVPAFENAVRLVLLARQNAAKQADRG